MKSGHGGGCGNGLVLRGAHAGQLDLVKDDGGAGHVVVDDAELRDGQVRLDVSDDVTDEDGRVDGGVVDAVRRVELKAEHCDETAVGVGPE